MRPAFGHLAGMMDTKHWLLTGMFLIGLVAWALFGSEMIGPILVVALALFLAFIGAVGAQRAQAVEEEEMRDLWSAAARGQAAPPARVNKPNPAHSTQPLHKATTTRSR